MDIFDVCHTATEKRRKWCITYYGAESLPKTVKQFMATHESRKQNDKFNGVETIYM